MSKKKPCDCIAKVNAALEEQGENTRVEPATVIDFKTGKAHSFAKLMTYRDNPKSRKPLRTVLCTYCPVCGRKYEDV